MSLTNRVMLKGSPIEKMRARLAGVVPTPNGCIEWPAARNGSGYGQVWDADAGKIVYVHRLAWEAYSGRSIPPGQYILHSCDNPPCCNPHHLRPGSALENAADAKDRGRLSSIPKPFGEDHGNAKLTPEKVVEARRLYRAGERLDVIAGMMGTSESGVHSAIIGKTWAHVQSEPPCDVGMVRAIKRELKQINHGTDSGYGLHLHRGEKACDDCKAAHATAVKERKTRKLAAALRSPEGGQTDE